MLICLQKQQHRYSRRIRARDKSGRHKAGKVLSLCTESPTHRHNFFNTLRVYNTKNKNYYKSIKFLKVYKTTIKS